MDNFPLNSFLVSLSADGIRLSVYDDDQLIVIFQTGGIRTVSRLKYMLTALLSKKEEQQAIISRRFDNFFKLESDADNKDLAKDIQQIISRWKKLSAISFPRSAWECNADASRPVSCAVQTRSVLKGVPTQSVGTSIYVKFPSTDYR